MPVTGMRKSLALVISLGALLLSAACSGPWNDPNEPEVPGETVYYGSYSSRLQHLDPARSYSAEEALFIDQIYESPLRYHFLKRPYILEPSLARGLPSVSFLNQKLELVTAQSSNIAFSLYTIKLKDNILYQPHPAFAVNSNNEPLYIFENEAASQQYRNLYDFPENGNRQLKAEDFVYGIKRLADPTIKSPLIGFLSNYIDGMTEFTQQVKELPRNSWLDLRNTPLTGVRAVDEHTFTIRIKGKYPQFRYWLAMHFFSPVPWEADRFYHNPGFQKRNLNIDWHPVGTGAFMMTSNDPNKGITLERNPNYRFDPYPSEGENDDSANGFLSDAGKPMPFIDRATFRQEKESLPQWSKFMQGWYDRSGDDTHNISSDNFDRAFVVSGSGVDLSSEMKQRGITISTEIKPSIYYYGFNMLDPVVGGYSEKKQKLRQAISIVWDMEDFLEIFTNGRGQAAMGPLPPGISGYQEGEAGINPYIYNWVNGQAKRKSVDEARSLLAEAGYPNGRDAKTGKPFILYLDTTGGNSGPVADWRRRKLEQIGIQLEYRTSDYVRFKEKIRTGNTQLFGWGWLADYPDPENMMFLLDSSQSSAKCNCDGANSANYDNPKFDKLFAQIKVMSDSPERLLLISKALDILRKDNPWIWGYHTKEYYLNNSWVYNTKRHGIAQDTLKYMRVDTEQRKTLQQEWNRPVVWPLIAIMGGIFLIILPAIIATRRRQNLRLNSNHGKEE